MPLFKLGVYPLPEGGILGAVASIKSWPEVLHPPKSIPHDHFSYGRWPQPRPFTVPQPTN